MPQQPNKVELIGHYGSDEIIALSAWTSTSRDLTPEKRDRIPELIQKLWTSGHKTPFEKGVVHFLVTTDIATHIHLLKHRISSINAESARYKEIKHDAFYVPDDFAGGKQYDFWTDALIEHTERGNQLYHQYLAEMTPVIGRKRAKESARYFKSYNSQITADVMFNMSSFANFIKLRTADDAQKEIQQVGILMWDAVQSIYGNPFQQTLKAIAQ
jgi:flavin-dependent thymidylate synthase